MGITLLHTIITNMNVECLFNIFRPFLDEEYSSTDSETDLTLTLHPIMKWTYYYSLVC